MIFNSIDQEFVYQDEQMFREYDQSNFIANAKYAINNTITPEKPVSGKHHSYMINKTIDTLNNIVVNKNIINVLNHLDTTDTEHVFQYVLQDVKTIKPSYLVDYVNLIGKTIEDLINGEDNIVAFLSGDVALKAKRQIVRTTTDLKWYYPKELVTDREIRKEPVTKALLDKVIVPSIKKFDKVKQSVNEEVHNVLDSIKTCDSTINAYKEVIYRMKQTGEINSKVLTRLDYLTYNSVRIYMDIKSYMAFMMLRKINNIIFNTKACVKLYERFVTKSTNVSINESTEYVESVIDGYVVPSDTESISSSLLDGNIDAYQIIADNISQFHKGILINSNSRYEDKDLPEIIHDVTSEDMEYSTESYESTQKIFILINECLTVLAKNSDDYLMIFDDLIEKSGLSLGIVDKYKPVVDNISDLSMYSPVSNEQNYDMYMRMLKEVSEYPTNMQRLARTIKETHSTIEMLQERFTKNINGEFKNASVITEVNAFLTEFETQYKTLVNLVAGNFMVRLKSLAVKLESLNKGTEDVRSTSDVYGESYDFMNIAYESIMSDIMDTNDIIFEAYSRQFFAEKEYLEKGVVVVFEDEQPTKSENKNEDNDKVSGTDNASNPTKDASTNTSGQKNVSKNAFEKIKNRLNIWIEDLKKAFRQYTKKYGTYHINWLNRKINANQTRKEYLLSRSYNNCHGKILPYDKMPRETILSNMNSLQNNIKNMTAGEIAKISSIETMAQKLLSFMPSDKLSTFSTKKTSDESDGSDVSTAVIIEKFYKVGNNNYESVIYKNGELKTLITEIISSMESYYNSFVDTIMNSINGVNEAIKSTIETYVTESVLFDEVDFYSEAEETPNSSTNANDGKDSSLIVKTEWIRTVCKTYTSSVLNSLRNRYADYLLLLKEFVPATATDTNAKTVEVKTDTTNENKSEETTDNK